MTASLQLWAHQEKAYRLTGAEFAKGHCAVTVVMPTGAGKTHLGCAFVARHLAKRPNGKVLWVAHREELVGQGFDSLESWGLSCGVIQSKPTRTFNPYRSVQVASTQTLLARGLLPDATLAVFDEFHHYASDQWAALCEHYRKLKIPIIGLTATPIRGDGRGFEGLMDSLVTPITMRELIQQGFLVPFELIAPQNTLRNNQIAAKPVDAYLKHARGRKAIVFASSVKMATEYRDQFKAAEVSAELVHGEMESGERRQILEAYKSGHITVLTNVGVLTEGFDDRPTACVIIARPVGSLSLYLQICGRGLRVSPETAKQNAILIDLHGSCRIHGAPDEDREWTLDGEGVRRKNLEKAKERFCAICKVTLDPSCTGLVCDFCEFVKPDAVVQVVNAKLVRYEAKLRETPEQRRAYFNRLRAERKQHGYSPKWVLAKYKAIYGEWPPRAWQSGP